MAFAFFIPPSGIPCDPPLAWRNFRHQLPDFRHDGFAGQAKTAVAGKWGLRQKGISRQDPNNAV
jgi:hypothetical protein